MAMITRRDGTRIFYKDWGPKEAQPIMFHHGDRRGHPDLINADLLALIPRRS